MRRKKRKQENVNLNGWMDTYADTITLLLTFFIILYSISITDNKKLEKLTQAFRIKVLGDGSTTGKLNGASIPDGELTSNSYNILVDKINKLLEKNGLTEEVAIREDDAGIILQLGNSILFDSARAELKADSSKTLDTISDIITQIDNEVIVQGHTDNVPIHSSVYKTNWELATARAVTVVKYLIEQKHISPSRLSATGYGEYRPLVDNLNEGNRSINRRVDILILQKKEMKQ